MMFHCHLCILAWPPLLKQRKGKNRDTPLPKNSVHIVERVHLVKGSIIYIRDACFAEFLSFLEVCPFIERPLYIVCGVIFPSPVVGPNDFVPCDRGN